jgi:hypothetical protein
MEASMNIPMKIRQRSHGRWPTLTSMPGDTPARKTVEPRHARRASGGLDKRRTANTKRGAAAGKARDNRGRKRVIESETHGGPYGKAFHEGRRAV